ncbi:hypothetical protein MLD38_032824 [Melastoma candidum]|uniref:Uncharacterized protein n=1 Tax=Melastoma candidum TaxID=119954 RepID=A0ACB9M798_9MYRT|nr:hypothetical protein MLD38_032824 [Melastoma candidum]
MKMNDVEEREGSKRRVSVWGKEVGKFLKEQRGRLYIIRRCVVMLLCWQRLRWVLMGFERFIEVSLAGKSFQVLPSSPFFISLDFVSGIKGIPALALL